MEKAGLESSQLKPPDHKACTYDQKPITLDGQMDMALSFGEEVLHATVYVKLVAPDQLLLSEAVCHQLGIVNYHPSVKAIPRCAAAAISSSPYTKPEGEESVEAQVVPFCATTTSDTEAKVTGKKELLDVTGKKELLDVTKEAHQRSGKLDTQSVVEKKNSTGTRDPNTQEGPAKIDDSKIS